jgi:hypothetical protein
LLHHVIKISAQVTDFVVAAGKADSDIEIAGADQCHLLLQFEHRALDQVGQHADRHTADDDGTRSGEHDDGMTLRTAQRDRGDGEQK